MIISNPDAKLGPAMRNLNHRQQCFVVALIEHGGINFPEAAARAGYPSENREALRATASRLAHDEDILKAIHEEAHRRMRSGAILTVSTLLNIINDPMSKNCDKLKACDMVLNRTGLHPTSEHTVKIEHLDTTEASMIKKIKLLAEKQGLDPKKLLGSVGVVDAEFVEISRPVLEADNLEDIL